MNFVLIPQRRIFAAAVALTLACSPLCISPVHAADVSAPSAQAKQAVKIKGVVVDSFGEPIIGAAVRVQGSDTKTGVITGIDGDFTIMAVPGAKLEITSIGFTPVTVAAQDGMTVELKEEATVLQGVEVVAYGTQKKVTVTGAISSIKSDDLVRTPVSSVNNVLAGQLSGVTTVQTSGEPGSDAAEIFVRGKATWDSDNAKPLIQVDGVERSMSDIDPNEIETITVLKDASATAVFGVRGANGVILITTKRGAEGKAKISVNLNFSMQKPTKLVEMADAVEYANFYNNMMIGDGKVATFSPEIIAKFTSDNPADRFRFPNTRWTDAIFKKTTFQQQHNVNVSGGNKKVNYFVSAGFFYQDGIFDQFGRDDYAFDYRYNRFNYRSNLDINVTNTTKFSINVAGKVDNSSKPRTGQGAEGMVKAIYGASPFSAYGFDDQGRYIVPTLEPSYNTEYDEEGNANVTVLPFIGSAPLTYITYQSGAYHNHANTLMLDLILEQKLDMVTKNLLFKVKGSYNSGYNSQKTLTSDVATYRPVLMEDGSLEYLMEGQDASPSYGSAFTDRSRNWYLEGSFSWNRSFGAHSLSALALYNQSKEYYPKTYSDIARTYIGLVGRVTYDYDNRYLAEVNFGYNGSENFAPGKRFGSFPAGSIGWIVSGEKFMQSLNPVISFLKLRATWGLVGNDRIGGNRFMYLSDPYVVNGSALLQRKGKDENPYAYVFGVGGTNDAVQFGAAEVQKNNPDVTWEKSFKQNYGVDLNFLNNRLMTNFDYFKEHRTNILGQDGTAPSYLGFTLPYTNFGIVDSWGWEVSVNWNDKIGKDFLYWARFNMSFNDNKIIENRQAPQSEDYMYTAGHRIGTRSLLQFWGFYDETAAARYEEEFGEPLPTQLVDNKKLANGDAIYVDLNHDGVIDASDYSREFGKTDDPRYIAGLSFGFSWKGWSFSTQLTGAWEVTRLIDGAFRRPFWNAAGDNQGGLLIYHLNDSWSETNRNPEYPRATILNNAQNYASSTLFEKDASYLRCKTMQLAYDFNMPWMKSLGLSQFQLSLSAYNLFTFTHYKWGDPENRASSSPSYPLTRTYTAGLKVAF
ncbi:MAG: TonB-dependent receptor [Muribaculaceae bacterium]|nr:TonB-dependent receptor [Muribaculaceae bacterium]